MNTIKHIDFSQLQAWLDAGEVFLINVRNPDEFAQWHITKAISIPLVHLEECISQFNDDPRAIVFQCLTGTRAEKGAEQALQKLTERTVYNLSGGIQAWDACGGDIIRTGKAHTVSIFRQVLIIAGGLVLLFSALHLIGFTWALVLTMVIGAGLVFAGVSGICAMALLEKMPWNR